MAQQSSTAHRCVNLDWVEVYCTESAGNFPHDAQYFVERGFHVHEREYGTRQYEQMFTLLDKDNLGFVEIRRKPVSGTMASRVKGIFSPYSCHIKLCNRYCYHPDAVNIFSRFLIEHGYTVERLFRLDLCMDFEKFDYGDDPKKFLQRYIAGRYSKINQGNISAHGADRWESRDWNSVSWGAPKSMVSTKFYNKTLELHQAKDKPYIRYAWYCAGLVDDWINLTKVAPDGSTYKPEIWRLEFSIRSSARQWYIIEDNHGRKTKAVAMPHALGVYATAEQRLQAFFSLAYHYFYFVKYEKDKRKDLCEEKKLFNYTNRQIYQIDRLMTDKPKDDTLEALRKRLVRYKMLHACGPAYEACNIILDEIDKEKVRDTMANPYDRSEREYLQTLLARRLQYPGESFGYSVEQVKALLKLEDDVF